MNDYFYSMEVIASCTEQNPLSKNMQFYAQNWVVDHVIVPYSSYIQFNKWRIIRSPEATKHNGLLQAKVICFISCVLLQPITNCSEQLKKIHWKSISSGFAIQLCSLSVDVYYLNIFFNGRCLEKTEIRPPLYFFFFMNQLISLQK